MDLKTALPFILDYYDCEVSQMISQKYGYSAMDAYKKNSCFRKLTRCFAILNSKCGISVASVFLTCGKLSKERVILAIPFTSRGADD